MAGINSPARNVMMLRAGATVTSINTHVREAGRRAVVDLDKGVSLELDRLGLRSLYQLIGLDTERGARLPTAS